MRIEWGNIRNILITMSGKKWPSSKHDSLLHSPKGLSTYMMFLRLHGIAVIILWTTVSSGKHILTCELCSLLWACCLFLSLSPAVPLHAKQNVVKPSPTLISQRLQPLWGCWLVLCRVTHFLCLQACEGICWTVCVTPVATSPQAPASVTWPCPEGLG